MSKVVWVVGTVVAAMVAAVGIGTNAETISGKVIGVTDGDTVTVLHAGAPVRVRLSGIDSPERNQAFGLKAKHFASQLAFGKDVLVESEGRDRYGRMLGHVTLPDGTNLNEKLVQAGYAWQYRKYSNDARLAGLEAEARAAGRGLWADPGALPPWTYRSLARTERAPGLRPVSTAYRAAPRWRRSRSKKGIIYAVYTGRPYESGQSSRPARLSRRRP